MHQANCFCFTKIQQEMGKDFPWVEYDDNMFCKVCRKSVPTRTQTSQESGGVWITQNWKKAVEKG